MTVLQLRGHLVNGDLSEVEGAYNSSLQYRLKICDTLAHTVAVRVFKEAPLQEYSWIGRVFHYIHAYFESFTWKKVTVLDSKTNTPLTLLVNTRSVSKRLRALEVDPSKDMQEEFNNLSSRILDKKRTTIIQNAVRFPYSELPSRAVLEYIEQNRSTWEAGSSNHQSFMDGFIISYSKDDKKIRIINNELLIDYDTAAIAQSPLSSWEKEEFTSLYDYLKTNYSTLVEEATESPLKTVFKHRKDVDIPRSIQVNADGNIFIHFNKNGDRLVGAGGFKKVKTAYDCSNGKLVASISIRSQHENCTSNIEKIHQFATHSLQLIGYSYKETTTHLSSDPKPYKRRFLMPLCEGDLTHTLMKATATSFCIGQDTLQRKKAVMGQMIEAVLEMHRAGYVHSDIKPENFLLHRDKKGERILLADHDLMYHENEKEERKLLKGTPPYWSPEYLRACSSRDEEQAIRANTSAADVWALGCTLLEMLSAGQFNPNRMLAEEKDKCDPFLAEMETFANDFRDRYLSSSEDPFARIIAKMLDPNPETRIKLEDALIELQAIVV